MALTKYVPATTATITIGLCTLTTATMSRHQNNVIIYLIKCFKRHTNTHTLTHNFIVDFSFYFVSLACNIYVVFYSLHKICYDFFFLNSVYFWMCMKICLFCWQIFLRAHKHTIQVVSFTNCIHLGFFFFLFNFTRWFLFLNAKNLFILIFLSRYFNSF